MCDVIHCHGEPQSWRGFDIYVGQWHFGFSRHQPYIKAFKHEYPGGMEWPKVFWSTNPYHQSGGYISTQTGKEGELQQKGSMMRGQLVLGEDSSKVNPVIMSIGKGVTENPWSMEGYDPNKCLGTKKRVPTDRNTFYMIMGVDISGRDPTGFFFKLT